MHNNKKILTNSVYMYTRMFLVTCVTLFTSRIVLRELGVVDFGIYNAVGGVVLFFSFLVPTLSQSVQRFINYEMGKENMDMVNKIFSMSILIHVMLAILIVIFAESIGLWFLNTQMKIPDDRIFAANCVYQCSVLSLVAIFGGIPYNAMIIAKQKLKVYAWFSIVTAILKLVAAYMLINSSSDKLIIYAVFMLAIYFISRLNVGIYCSMAFKDLKFKWIWNFDLFKQMLGFCGWTLYRSIGGMAYSYGLNIILNIFCGAVVNAARAISIQIQHVIDSLVSSFQTAVTPQIIQSYAACENSYVNKLFLSSTKITVFLMALITIPAYIEINEVLYLWLGQYPPHTVSFSRFVLLICCLQAIFQPVYTLIQATGRIKAYQIMQGTSQILIIPLSCLYLSFGAVPEIVFEISFVLITFSNILGLIILKKLVPYINFTSYVKQIGMSLSICIITYYIILLLSSYISPSFFRVLINICITFVFLLFGGLLVMNHSEKKMIKNLLCRK